MDTPEPIFRDDKDWTWVLARPCDECGLDATAVTAPEVGALVRQSIPQWRAALARDDASSRPARDTWSVTEYAAHVRDVHALFGERLALMLAEDNPSFANWDQDATAIAAHYSTQNPHTVAVELSRSANKTAELFDSVRPAQYERRGTRSNGSEFTVTTLGQYYWHDIRHHMHDIR